MSLLRAYASTASTSSDRSRAISCVSGGIAVGTMIGPGFYCPCRSRLFCCWCLYSHSLHSNIRTNHNRNLVIYIHFLKIIIIKKLEVENKSTTGLKERIYTVRFRMIAHFDFLHFFCSPSSD
uniref:Secreted protein n=1 Tax=Heterorhabditis bacteriophora TaxID=37862 RepID=A0A1I7X3T7_HETBA